MKKVKLIVLCIFLVHTAELFADWRDTGFITWEQPDGTDFIARSWGDEFFFGWRQIMDIELLNHQMDGIIMQL